VTVNHSSFLAWLTFRAEAIRATHSAGETRAAIRMYRNLREKTFRVIRSGALDDDVQQRATQLFAEMHAEVARWELEGFEGPVAAFELSCLALFEWPEA
jgi:hypothetical protein